MGIEELRGTLLGEIIDVILESEVGYRIEPWEAERLAEDIMEQIYRRLFDQ